jgi:hypothetical protein
VRRPVGRGLAATSTGARVRWHGRGRRWGGGLTGGGLAIVPSGAGSMVFKPIQIDAIQFKLIQTISKLFRLQLIQKGPS